MRGGGGVVQNRESPDFRPPEVGRYDYGCRAFSIVARKLWNSLPEDVKNAKTVICFKNKLKTLHLF